METREYTISGVPLVMPPAVYEGWPCCELADIPDCCGAGDGIGNHIVPDSILGLRISPACWIHDRMFSMAAPAWADFHQSNSVFLRNLLALIAAQSGTILRPIRNYRAMTYYNAVDQGGAKYFWKTKMEQKI